MSDIEDAARKYIKTRFKHQGRSIDGMDCVGLIIAVAHDLNITDFDFTNYKVIPDSKLMRQYLGEHLDKIPIWYRKPGDIFYMSFYQHPQHLAIYTGNTIIHAASLFGGVVEHSLDTFWNQRIREVYRYRR